MKTLLTFLKINMGKWVLLFIAICFFLGVQGCIGALPAVVYPIYAVASSAMSGFVAYKSIQMTTGGEAEVRFKNTNLLAKNKRALSSLKTLAIYPGGRNDIRLAEILSKSGEFTIITPYSVRKALADGDRVPNIKEMTSEEKRSFAFNLCKSLGADGIFLYSEDGHSYDASYWSLKKPEAITKFQADVYSLEQNGIIWTQEGEIALKTGSSMPSQDEVDRIAVSAIADKFLNVVGKR